MNVVQTDAAGPGASMLQRFDAVSQVRCGVGLDAAVQTPGRRAGRLL